METLWEGQLARRTQTMTSSVVREILKITAGTGVDIGFAFFKPKP